MLGGQQELPPAVPQQWGKVRGPHTQLSLHTWSAGVSVEAEISRPSVGPCEEKIAEDLVAASFQDVQE